MSLEGFKQTEDPRVVIESILHEMMAGGGVDSELGQIKSILAQLYAGKISGKRAIELAEAVRDNRQESR